MNKIECRFENTSILVDYAKILDEKISRIYKAIGFNDSEITWIIFNPDERKSKGIIGHIRIGCFGEEYGFCHVKEKEIWISTSSIMRDNAASPFSKIHDQIKLSLKTCDFLADVIIDEITHIQTGNDHGSPQYDMQYQKNKKNYYLSLLSDIERARLEK